MNCTSLYKYDHVYDVVSFPKLNSKNNILTHTWVVFIKVDEKILLCKK